MPVLSTFSKVQKNILPKKHELNSLDTKKGNGYLWIRNAEGSGDKQITFL